MLLSLFELLAPYRVRDSITSVLWNNDVEGKTKSFSMCFLPHEEADATPSRLLHGCTRNLIGLLYVIFRPAIAIVLFSSTTPHSQTWMVLGGPHSQAFGWFRDHPDPLMNPSLNPHMINDTILLCYCLGLKFLIWAESIDDLGRR